MSRTYTIFNHGNYQVGLSSDDAASDLLAYDGYQYEIRTAEDGAGWELWVSSASRNSTSWKGVDRKSVIFSLEDDEAEARQEIFDDVILSGNWERGELTCSDDETTYNTRRDSVTEEILAEAEIDDDDHNAEDRRKHVDDIVGSAYHHEFTNAEWINEAIKLLVGDSAKAEGK